MTSITHPTNTDGTGLRKRRLISLISGVIAVGVLLAGCGGSKSSSSSNPAAAGSQSHARAQFLAYATCMRSHGVPGYPDPVVSGAGNSVSVKISPGSADPNAPAFRSADRGCRDLLPDGVVPGAVSEQQQAQDVVFVDCMRAHGVPDFPDAGHHAVFTLPATINEQSPAFLRAYHACPQPSSLSVDQTP